MLPTYLSTCKRLNAEHQPPKLGKETLAAKESDGVNKVINQLFIGSTSEDYQERKEELRKLLCRLVFGMSLVQIIIPTRQHQQLPGALEKILGLFSPT